MSTSEILVARDHDAALLRAARRRGEIERVRRGAYRAVPDGGTRPGDVPPGGGDGLDGRGAAGGRSYRAGWSAARGLALDRARAVSAQLRAVHWCSHATAAMLHDLPLWRLPSAVHLVQGYRASSRAAVDVRRHLLEVPPEHRTRVLDLPATTLARTVADCVTTLPPLEGLVVADAALARGLDAEESVAIVQGRRQGRRRGLLVLGLADPGAESPWETWLRYVAHWTGLPRPRTQVPVETRLGRHRVDLGWPDHGVLAEFDGLVKYRAGAFGEAYDPERALVAEKRREDAIAEQTGCRPLRVTSKDAARPESVSHRLLARFPADVRRAVRRPALLTRPT
ncbi:hypothetical protein [Isoptericola halotolerans]|uniref:Transcriptional regulator, AbiEi antitoxin, Type IV TA system n=1 Tax=Isoptericola halotolerans TaxID=300560 RepID=A0ABX2A789_9MICO|nr:hypothetical protein [Isoptericola halotolerans]NOV98744.1 hypothetical protein [Isoptericola halotolerans]